ncbi:MAG: hypothetical protein LBU76_04230 [Azoarcus sp.]|jgi:hypothetical protein|nr:hypothetical protein [Azoarcus sp.]
MLPLYPFVAGLLVGAVAVRAYRAPKTRDNLKDAGKKIKKKSAEAQETLRHAAISGLSAIESSSARWRDRLQAGAGAAAENPAASAAETEKPAVKKPASRPRKPSAKPAAAADKAES